MLEQTRLSYLEAMGVANWMPRAVLANAAQRVPADVPPPPLQAAPVSEPPEKPTSALIAPEVVAPPARKHIPIPVPRPGATSRPAVESPPEPAQQTAPAVPVGPFYVQLWLAGPCALLIETQEPGLESASPTFRLLNEILRAAELPTPARLYADFHWPLTRNRQLDNSAVAASQGLQAFMQARLESQQIDSIGCFGAHTVLLSDPDAEAIADLAGRVESIDQLPPAWFVPSLEGLMAEPEAKRRLWHFLKRIKAQWAVVND
ncbi:superantigen-like protein SSL4 [Pseudomonas saliphila]|uniref:energy transducer TonB n=1 Tax=Pseudomonas saliphila TaxID=2586906 RepID=UPI00123AB65A|nr:energy transducer TonB [Pseudomonas saliphila]